MTDTTIANHGHRWQMWLPSTPHEALRLAPTQRMDGWQPPKQAGIIFWVVEGVYGCWSAPLLWQWFIATASEYFEGQHTINNPQNYTCLLGGLSPINSMRWRGVQELMLGARGPFPPAAAMVAAVMMPVVFCSKAPEKCNKSTKISFLWAMFLFITIYCKTYCNSHNTNCSVAGARTTLVQCNPGILGIARKL